MESNSEMTGREQIAGFVLFFFSAYLNKKDFYFFGRKAGVRRNEMKECGKLKNPFEKLVALIKNIRYINFTYKITYVIFKICKIVQWVPSGGQQDNFHQPITKERTGKL